MKVYNAEGQILGRLATRVATDLLDGEEVTVLNADKCIITGTRKAVMANYTWKRDVGSTRKGPFFPRLPDRMFRRTVRGMLPWSTTRGREAFRRLMAHTGVPAAMKEAKPVPLPVPALKMPRFMTLGEVARLLGADFR